MNKNCGNCRFSAESTTGDGLMCRRFARYPIQEKVGWFKTKTIHSHPIVVPNELCGEWQPETQHVRWD